MGILVLPSCMKSLREYSVDVMLSLALIQEGAQLKEEGRPQNPKSGLEA